MAIWPQAQAFLRQRAKFIVDLGCGTGDSTRQLAEKHPDFSVLGVDRSALRLSKRRAVPPDNALCLRMDQFDLLRLLQRASMRAAMSYLLYPNPSPKAEHLKRRWHAHPIFPTLLACSQAIELRTNWAIYAQEFVSALSFCGWQAELRTVDIEAPISLFEAKYQASGHALYRVDGTGPVVVN